MSDIDVSAIRAAIDQINKALGAEPDMVEQAEPELDAPAPVPPAEPAAEPVNDEPAAERAKVPVSVDLHKTAADWGLAPELLKSWNPDATFEPGELVFITPPEVS
jgi:hypothetical protein